jgi:hypothetical protein
VGWGADGTGAGSFGIVVETGTFTVGTDTVAVVTPGIGTTSAAACAVRKPATARITAAAANLISR